MGRRIAILLIAVVVAAYVYDSTRITVDPPETFVGLERFTAGFEGEWEKSLIVRSWASPEPDFGHEATERRESVLSAHATGGGVVGTGGGDPPRARVTDQSGVRGWPEDCAGLLDGDPDDCLSHDGLELLPFRVEFGRPYPVTEADGSTADTFAGGLWLTETSLASLQTLLSDPTIISNDNYGCCSRVLVIVGNVDGIEVRVATREDGQIVGISAFDPTTGTHWWYHTLGQRDIEYD